jgi:hypothetical protein
MDATTAEPDHPIIERPYEHRLAELRYVIEAPDGGEPFIDMVLAKGSVTRRLRFWSPRDFNVQEGFSPDAYLGIQILDVSRRQLEDIAIEVSCFENTPGFSFSARTIEEIPV